MPPSSNTVLITLNILLCIKLSKQFAITELDTKCPPIVTREEWHARPANTSALVTFPPTHVVIHHTATGGCEDREACGALLESIQRYHMDVRGWEDIGYNFLVGGDGLIYEGRGWNKTGTHTRGFNDRSIGISFIGTYITKLPPQESIDATKQLIACGVAKGQISESYSLMGHRQASATECPGSDLFNDVKKWKNWTPKPKEQ